MRVRRFRAGLVAIGVGLSLALVVGPAAAQDEPEGTLAEAPSEELAAILPAEVAGVPLEPMEVPIPTVLAALPAEDPEAAATLEAITAASDVVGVPVERMILGNARALDYEALTGAIIWSLRAEGFEDGSAFVGPFVDLLKTTGQIHHEDAVAVPTEIDGREAFLIGNETLIGDGVFDTQSDAGETIAVASGPFALVVQGDSPSILEVLAALP